MICNIPLLEKQRHRGGRHWYTFWEVLKSQHFHSKSWIQGGMGEEATEVSRGWSWSARKPFSVGAEMGKHGGCTSGTLQQVESTEQMEQHG